MAGACCKPPAALKVNTKQWTGDQLLISLNYIYLANPGID